MATTDDAAVLGGPPGAPVAVCKKPKAAAYFCPARVSKSKIAGRLKSLH